MLALEVRGLPLFCYLSAGLGVGSTDHHLEVATVTRCWTELPIEIMAASSHYLI